MGRDARMSIIESIVLIVSVLGNVTFGVATHYTEEKFGGNPLYCDQFMPGLTYSENTEPWIALDIEEYKSGRVKCGDEFLLVFESGEKLRVRALDAGTFQGYYVSTWPELDIVVDLPEHLFPAEGLSARVVLVKIGGTND